MVQKNKKMFKIPSSKIKLKTQKIFKQKNINKNNFIKPHSFIVKVNENVTINRDQLLLLNQIITKIIKKRGVINFDNILLNPFTKKSVGIRMGKGKGAIYGWCCCLKRGSTLLEINSFKNNLLNNKMQKKIACILPCSVYKINCHI